MANPFDTCVCLQARGYIVYILKQCYNSDQRKLHFFMTVLQFIWRAREDNSCGTPSGPTYL